MAALALQALVVLAFSVAACLCEEQLDVVALAFVHRHGDRTPYYFMPKDAASNEKWGNWTGVLTPKGSKQLEQVGRIFRERYLLGQPYQVMSPSFQRGQYYVRSTDVDRTIESALSFAKGFFPDGTGPENGLSGRAQVVPVQTMPQDLDSLLMAFNGKACKRVKELQENIVAEASWAKIDAENRDFWNEVADAAGFERSTISLVNASAITDPLICDQAHGYAWPESFSDNGGFLFNKTLELYRDSLRPYYAGSLEMRKLIGGNMLGQVISRFERAVGKVPSVPEIPSRDTPSIQDGTGSDTVKVTHFSAHDTTLIALLGALDVFDERNPPYASTVVFELMINATTNQHFVRAFYNKGPEQAFDKPLRLCDLNSDYCSLEAFVEKFSPLVSADYEKDCLERNATQGRKQEGSQALTGTNAKYVVIALLSAMLGAILVLTCRKSARLEEEKHYGTLPSSNV